MEVNEITLVHEHTFTEIVNVFIALLTLILAYYVFVHQKKQNIKAAKLQWFKELIINPKFHYVDEFFREVSNIKGYFNNSDLTENEKDKVVDHLKRAYSTFNLSFLDTLFAVAPELYKDTGGNIDDLIDGMSKTIYNDELKLNNETTYKREIENKIKSSYNNFLNSIFSYKG